MPLFFTMYLPAINTRVRLINRPVHEGIPKLDAFGNFAFKYCQPSCRACRALQATLQKNLVLNCATHDEASHLTASGS